MTQLSRPFQIVLAATVLFALVWVVALRGHSASSSSTPVASVPVAGTPASATARTAAAAKAKAPAGTTHIEGMTRAVTHAHEAVAASQRAADRSASASAEAPSKGAAGTVTKSSVTVTRSKRGAPSSSVTVTKTSAHAAPAQQVVVEGELKRGEVAVVLFWNKKGADDVAVHGELQNLLAAHHEVAVHPNKAQVRKLRLATGLELEKKIAVHYATAAQVASFGSFTKTVQVYGTPTILIINKHGAVTTMNGLTDAFAIEQTIDEARQA